MRKFERRVAPDCLQENADVWNAEFAAKRAADPKATFRWRNDDCYQTFRKVLTASSQECCAFCDVPLGPGSLETVEHFRPKSKFPELAYHWENLFPCCDVCQNIKGEDFDEALLKPDASDYTFERYFLANGRTGALEIPASNSPEDQKRAEITCSIYGLNTPARCKARRRELKKYRDRSSNDLDDYEYRFFLQDA